MYYDIKTCGWRALVLAGETANGQQNSADRYKCPDCRAFPAKSWSFQCSRQAGSDGLAQAPQRLRENPMPAVPMSLCTIANGPPINDPNRLTLAGSGVVMHVVCGGVACLAALMAPRPSNRATRCSMTRHMEAHHRLPSSTIIRVLLLHGRSLPLKPGSLITE